MLSIEHKRWFYNNKKNMVLLYCSWLNLCADVCLMKSSLLPIQTGSYGKTTGMTSFGGTNLRCAQAVAKHTQKKKTIDLLASQDIHPRLENRQDSAGSVSETTTAPDRENSSYWRNALLVGIHLERSNTVVQSPSEQSLDSQKNNIFVTLISSQVHPWYSIQFKSNQFTFIYK